eukprot:CAMPEP_0117606344 /NCGR_PEP_ID=MMETSP0784-20121206/79664_1 /TAXON_ID=39447 /ORGANISM="" /LENGTH=88 /DNA_ID=CAMNT_0005409423 /DNA_START=509 /DNA_END=775 /DNA_ORIENTATION=-
MGGAGGSATNVAATGNFVSLRLVPTPGSPVPTPIGCTNLPLAVACAPRRMPATLEEDTKDEDTAAACTLEAAGTGAWNDVHASMIAAP